MKQSMSLPMILMIQINQMIANIFQMFLLHNLKINSNQFILLNDFLCVKLY